MNRAGIMPGGPLESGNPVSTAADLHELWATLVLARTRELVVRRHAIPLAVLIGTVYALIALVVGQMLVFGLTGVQSTTVIYLPQGSPWWNFPLLVVEAPNAVLSLPFFATGTMVLVAAGIGLGMSVAVLLAVDLVRERRRDLGRPASVGAAAGLTPAMIALVTLGACCSTTAAATAGIGVVAQASGSNVDQLLANSWFLGVFQVAVLWVSLIAQERLVLAYASLGAGPAAFEDVGRTRDARAPAYAAVLRAGLLVGGVTWSLAMVADWTGLSPWNASPANWCAWILLHQVPALLAVGVALYPREIGALFNAGTASARTLALRLLAASGGIGLLAWYPSVLVGSGLHGWANELLGALGYPASTGAVAPPTSDAVALGFRWGLQFLLLGAFALSASLAPDRVFPRLAGAVTGRSERSPEEIDLSSSVPRSGPRAEEL